MMLHNTEDFLPFIKKAKRKVQEAYGSNLPNRRWVILKHDSYASEDNRLEIYIYEGSPIKGYIIVNYGTEKISAFSAWGKHLFTYDIRRLS